MISMLFIGSLLAISILGYLITPDASPYANHQILEWACKKPGFKGKYLEVKNNHTTKAPSFFTKMLYGAPATTRHIPYSTYYFHHDRIVLTEYSETPIKDPQKREISLVDALYQLDPKRPPITGSDSIVRFTLLSGEVLHCSVSILQNRVQQNCLKNQIYHLGSDRYGRDLLSQLMIGTRVSLSVGFIAVLISLIIGISLGALAGYFGGRTDHIILWLINVVWSIPTLLLVIAITFALGKGFWQVFIAVGLTMWVEVARVVRGQIISLREKEFVEAARALGYRNVRIIFRHILPNVMSPVIVISAANFASAILIEAGLSFLGIGVQPPVPSWGSMIKENYGYIILDSAHLAILPGIAIMLTVLAFMLIGNGLRDALDVRTQEQE